MITPLILEDSRSQGPFKVTLQKGVFPKTIFQKYSCCRVCLDDSMQALCFNIGDIQMGMNAL